MAREGTLESIVSPYFRETPTNYLNTLPILYLDSGGQKRILAGYLLDYPNLLAQQISLPTTNFCWANMWLHISLFDGFFARALVLLRPPTKYLNMDYLNMEVPPLDEVTRVRREENITLTCKNAFQ
jgi:hypothetical protein